MVASVTSNLPDFVRSLREVSKKVQATAVRRAASAAGAVYRRIARAEAPIDSGTLKRSIYLARLRNQKRDEVGYTVRARAGKKYRAGGKRKTSSDAFYARFVILGHLFRTSGKTQGGARSRALSRSRRREAGAKGVPANPFIDRAFNSGSGEALSAFNRRMEFEIAKIDAAS